MRKFLTTVAVAALALAGCGSDGGGGGGGDVDVAGDTKFTGKGGADFCSYLKDLEKREEELDLGSGENTPENRRKAKEALDIFDDLQDKAPQEIKADVSLVLTQIRPIFQSLADGEDASTTATSQQPTAEEAKKIEAAGKRVEEYSGKVCGIEDDAPDGGSDPAPSGDTGEPGDVEGEQAPPDEDQPADG